MNYRPYSIGARARIRMGRSPEFLAADEFVVETLKAALAGREKPQRRRRRRRNAR